MRLQVSTTYLDPVELGENEWVSVNLPDGRMVTVFGDAIYVATGGDVRNRRDGKKVWNGASPAKYPYGRVGVN
jgi:hypothetical protein